AIIAIERLLARITTRIVAISRRQSEELCRYLRLSADRVTVLPLGLDLGRFLIGDPDAARRRFRERLGVSDRLVFTMVGRLTGIKNHPLAFRAFAAVAAEAPDALLVLIGGGEDETTLRSLVDRLGIADRVRFGGWWDDLEAVYYGSDVIALSSDNEGTPVCLIEALACGRPVIATDVGGVPDLLEEGRLGILVPPRDDAAFAEALLAVANAPGRETQAMRPASSIA